ncbi:MAG TPA: hydroxysqualene dehydroxylase HpnE [Candidatus Angelobacter sp.]|jgi:zeta-carotene desaturase|nr:hydroxysqualene dehydroxylase HpnE [Candidatus Angelobacter sp.]
MKTAGIIGGGLAGLAAGCALADAGFRVMLFERRPYVGGRASSYEHPGTGEVVDNCQHVLLGCCTNLIHFYDQLGVSDQIQWFSDLTFIEPGGRASHLGSSVLPPPLHNLPAFLRSSSLSWMDKLAIARALTAMMPMRSIPADSGDSDENFLQWLQRHGQTERSIERFWKVVLVSALNEDLEHTSVRYAVQVFRESFLKSAEAGRMGVPRIPLSQLYGHAVDYIRAREGEVLLRCSVNTIGPGETAVRISSNAGEREFDYAVLAVPFHLAAGMLPSSVEAESLKLMLGRFESSPITGVHLWFDRPITDLPHAVLLDRTIQWMFHKTMFHQNGPRKEVAPEEMSQHGTEAAPSAEAKSYIEVVISSSKTLVEKSRQEILDLAMKELAEFFPAIKNAKLVKSTVIKEVHATYSVRPGLDQYRPSAKTEWPRLFLSGDWTATGWPATMEGAVRSGYLAAEAITESAGESKKFAVPDMKAKGLMRLFG